MRCDVNVSVRKRQQSEFGTRVEIKNMNSFSAMQKAIEFEIDRQASNINISSVTVSRLSDITSGVLPPSL